MLKCLFKMAVIWIAAFSTIDCSRPQGTRFPLNILYRHLSRRPPTQTVWRLFRPGRFRESYALSRCCKSTLHIFAHSVTQRTRLELNRTIAIRRSCTPQLRVAGRKSILAPAV